MPQDGQTAINGSSDGDARPSVFIISDVRLVRDGLAQQLRRDGRVDLQGAARPDDAALGALTAAPPAAVVLDLGVAGGMAFAQQLASDLPAVRVIGFSICDDDKTLAEWARTGVCGYIEREGTADDIIGAVLHAMKGELLCSPKIAAQLLAQLAGGPRAPAAATGVEASATALLTPREGQILRQITTGATNKEIARSLGISAATVKNHVHHVLEKLAVTRRAQASALASALARSPQQIR